MLSQRQINANELRELLKDKYGKVISIDCVDIADANKQFEPKHLAIGFGGVLNIYLTVKER